MASNFTNDSGTGTVVADGFVGPNENVADIAAIGTADATDLATAIALANATKARFNELLAALKATS